MPSNVQVKTPANYQPVRSIGYTQGVQAKQLAQDKTSQTMPAAVAGVDNISGKVLVQRPGSEQAYATSADSSRLSPLPGKTVVSQRGHANQGNRELDIAESAQPAGKVVGKFSASSSVPSAPVAQVKPCSQPVGAVG